MQFSTVLFADTVQKEESNLTPYFAYHSYDPKRNLGNGLEVGLIATKPLSDKLSAELGLGIVLPKSSSLILIPNLGVNLLYDFDNIGKFVPYVLAGINADLADPALAGLDVGAGLRYKANKFFQPRLEVKNIMNGSYHGSDWVVSLVLSWLPVTDKLEQAFAKTGKIENMNMDINFDVNQDIVKEEYMPVLTNYAEFLTNHPELKIVINGYTDNTGDKDYNLELSKKRAASVAKVLIEKFAISADRITSVGYGVENPVASNDTPEGQAKNRRIEANTTK